MVAATMMGVSDSEGGGGGSKRARERTCARTYTGSACGYM